MPSGAWAAGVAVLAASVACGGASTPEPAPPVAVAPVGPPPPPARRLVRLSYLAPSDCPTVDGYLSHVRARSSSLDLQERGGAAGESVDVRLDPELERPGWLGQLRIEGSRPLEREVHGERCQDVVEALALSTVLRLEGGDAAASSAAAAGATPAGAATSGVPGAAGATTPGAASATPAEPAPASAPEPPAAAPPPAVSGPEQPETPAPATPAQPSAAAVEPAAGAPSAGTTPTDEAPDDSAASSAAASVSGAPAVEEPSEPPLRPDEPIRVPAGSDRVEVDADSDTSGAPSEPFRAQLAPTLALFVGYASVPGHAFELTLASEVRYGETLGSWTSPIALTGARGNERVDAADLDITLLTAQLGLCPPAPLAESWVWLRLCANVRGGAVYVEVTPRAAQLIDDPRWRPWLALVPSLELGVPLSEHWTIRASAELAVHLVRDTFGAALDESPDPDVLPLYKPQAVSVEGGLGVGYTF